MNAELEGLDPDRFYSAGSIAERLVSNRRDGSVRTKTIAGYATKGARLPDGGRLWLVGQRRPGGWVFLGSEVLEFFAKFHSAWGGSGLPEPSDSSDSSDVARDEPKPAATGSRARTKGQLARATGAVTAARGKALVRGPRPRR
jgi:hypothetical protein